MKFGILLPNYGASAARLALIDTVNAAESLGFDSAWLTDHIAMPAAHAGSFGHIYESVTSMAYLAGQTRAIKLGLSALVLPMRNAVEVAKEIATIDVLSGGRILLAAGIGWAEREYKNLGVNFTNRAKRMNESLKVLRTLWRGQSTASFKGQYYNFENLSFSPTPIQAGGPPLWVAGDSVYALKRAVFLADGWHPNASTPETIQSLLAQVKAMIQNRPFTVAIRFCLDFNKAYESGPLLSGSPEQIIEQLKCYKMNGMNYAMIGFSASTQAERERWMKKFMQEINPYID